MYGLGLRLVVVPEIVFCKQQCAAVRRAGGFHGAMIIPLNIAGICSEAQGVRAGSGL